MTDGDGEHAGDGPDQQPARRWCGQRLVDDQADQERRGQRDDRRGHDQGHHDGDAAAVGPEECGDAAAADRRAVELGPVGRVDAPAGAAAPSSAAGRPCISSMRHLLGVQMLRLPHGVVTTASPLRFPRGGRRAPSWATCSCGSRAPSAGAGGTSLAPWDLSPHQARALRRRRRAGRRPALRPRRVAAHRAAVGHRGGRRPAGARPGRADGRPRRPPGGASCPPRRAARSAPRWTPPARALRDLFARLSADDRADLARLLTRCSTRADPLGRGTPAARDDRYGPAAPDGRGPGGRHRRTA